MIQSDMIHSTRQFRLIEMRGTRRYMVTGRVACIYLPRHGHESDTADALPRLTYRRRPSFYTLSPRSNDLEVIRSPSNVRSKLFGKTSREYRRCFDCQAERPTAEGAASSHPPHREHTARTSKPNSDWRDSHSRTGQTLSRCIFFGVHVEL